jgi:hypothetical protein
MSRPAERLVFKLARFIAGPERRHWLDAIQAELDHLPRAHRLDWALGAFVAAVKDAAPRALLALGLLIGFPWLAAAAGGSPALNLGVAIFRAVGAPFDLLLPATYPLPLLAGILLGAVHRWRYPVLVGAIAFALHQVGPSLYRHVTYGSSRFYFWSPDMRPLGLDNPWLAIAGIFVLWCVGLWLGTRLRERLGGGPARR